VWRAVLTLWCGVQFDDHLIAKVFTFQFLNSYGSFFYIAFIKVALLSGRSVHHVCRGKAGQAVTLGAWE
jgi:hypothetical protein